MKEIGMIEQNLKQRQLTAASYVEKINEKLSKIS